MRVLSSADSPIVLLFAAAHWLRTIFASQHRFLINLPAQQIIFQRPTYYQYTGLRPSGALKVDTGWVFISNKRIRRSRVIDRTRYHPRHRFLSVDQVFISDRQHSMGHYFSPMCHKAMEQRTARLGNVCSLLPAAVKAATSSP
jgi:hypothetical protein